MRNFAPLNAMMERARMSEMDIYHRTRDVSLHYKLPFDAPPPEELRPKWDKLDAGNHGTSPQ